MKTFEFDGREYTVKKQINGERIVEIPLLEIELLSHPAETTLEIGNVSHHHLDFSWFEIVDGTKVGEHTVVDLYEQASNEILNIDIVDYKPKEKFKSIVSVSTFEHIDENGNSAEKALLAWDNIIENCLADNGSVWFTIPCNQNVPLTNAIINSTFFTTFLFGMKRTDRYEWQQCSPVEAAEQPYGGPRFKRGNGILIGEYYK